MLIPVRQAMFKLCPLLEYLDISSSKTLSFRKQKRYLEFRVIAKHPGVSRQILAHAMTVSVFILAAVGRSELGKSVVISTQSSTLPTEIIQISGDFELNNTQNGFYFKSAILQTAGSLDILILLGIIDSLFRDDHELEMLNILRSWFSGASRRVNI